jgi:imidazolonepropionase-like amidohydrolase
MRLALLLAALALTAACSRPSHLVRLPAATADRLVFRHVDVFTGESLEVLRDQDVWVEGGRVEHVGPGGERPVPEGVRKIDGAGRTLLPGLVDLHVHALGGSSPPWKYALPSPERNLQRFLWAGITTVVDLGGELKEIVQLRDRLARGELPGPRMLVAGPHITAPGGHPVAMLHELAPWYLRLLISDERFALQVASPETARRAVERLVKGGVDVVKVTSDTIPLSVPVIEEATLGAVVAAAHAAGKLVFAHVGTNEDARRMARAGVDVFAHGIYREVLEDDTIALLVEKRISVVPTMKVFDVLDRVLGGELETDAVHEAVRDPEVWQAVTRRPAEWAPPASFNGYLDAVHASRTHWLSNVRRLKEAGVPVLAGSDSPNVGSFGGAALHQELDMLQAAGLTAAEVLQAATWHNARTIRRDADLGSIAPGRLADLLLVSGDPTADLANVHRIERVFLGGREVERR